MNKLTWGIVIGLLIGVVANPLMPPAFFLVGGIVIWWLSGRPKTIQTEHPPRKEPEEEEKPKCTHTDTTPTG